MSETVLKLAGITRSFNQGRGTLEVLKGIDLEIREGEIVALVGPSGSGKSTLLHIAGLLEPPSQGTIEISGQAAARLTDEQRTQLRRLNIGFVYQYHHLLPEFSAVENIILPQMITGLARSEAHKRAIELLKWLGLEHRAVHRPGELSGGEQQRVAIARALANGPRLLLADEPTGNLDPNTAEEVFAVMLKLVRGAKLAALIATHNPALAERMDRTLRVEGGHVVAV
jgi:lipoprotein-releasing system ATP-binding protein